jgi:hypothetical protein
MPKVFITNSVDPANGPYTRYCWCTGDFFRYPGEERFEVRAYQSGQIERYYQCMGNSNPGPCDTFLMPNETWWPPRHPAEKCIYRP